MAFVIAVLTGLLACGLAGSMIAGRQNKDEFDGFFFGLTVIGLLWIWRLKERPACPECGRGLNEANLQPATCPHCHAQLAWTLAGDFRLRVDVANGGVVPETVEQPNTSESGITDLRANDVAPVAAASAQSDFGSHAPALNKSEQPGESLAPATLSEIVGVVLIIIGLFGVVIAMNKDTSVEVPGYMIGSGEFSTYVPKRVNNIGLMDERRNWLLVSALMVVVGILLCGSGFLATSKDTAGPRPNSTRD